MQYQEVISEQYSKEKIDKNSLKLNFKLKKKKK